nr:hypothetical protein [Candidatus Levybacteria bacterium]
MVDRKGARRITIRHTHNPQTSEQKQDNFNNAVEKVRSSGFSPREQAVRIENLRKAHGINLASEGEIFTAGCPK